MNLPTRTILTLALAACAALAQAGTVSVSAAQVAPYAPGDRVTFTVQDSRARDMFDLTGGFSAADFHLLYDPAALLFESIEYAPWVTQAAAAFWFDNASAPPGGTVQVTMAGFDELELPDAPDTIFSVSFIVGTAPQGFVTVAPPDPPSYAFTPDTLRFAVNAIPLPATWLLAAAGLAALGLSRRRQG